LPGIFAARETESQARVLALDDDMTCALVDRNAPSGMDDRSERSI
jgi:hypothetical protein